MKRFFFVFVLIFTFVSMSFSEMNDAFDVSFAGTLGDFKKLESNGIDFNQRDRNGSTLLMYAAMNSSSEILEYLIQKKVSISDKDSYGFTALFWAIMKGRNLKNIEILLKNGANIYDRTATGMTPLMCSFYNEYISQFELAKRLYELGSNINDSDMNGASVFQHALIASNDIRVIKYLIDNNINKTKQDNNGNNPLIYAVQNPLFSQVLDLGIFHKNDFYVIDKFGLSAIHYAAMQNENTEVFRKLKELDINLNIINNDKITPLMLASEYNSIEIVSLLIELKADPKAIDVYGNTAFDYAKRNKKIYMSELYWELNNLRF